MDPATAAAGGERPQPSDLVCEADDVGMRIGPALSRRLGALGFQRGELPRAPPPLSPPQHWASTRGAAELAAAGRRAS